ncbi:hypothetical protein OC845_006874 [Tilletia horrida]|nr:hypothetical protein OC845_006874 [Tilletia horrida]
MAGTIGKIQVGLPQLLPVHSILDLSKDSTLARIQSTQLMARGQIIYSSKQPRRQADRRRRALRGTLNVLRKWRQFKHLLKTTSTTSSRSELKVADPPFTHETHGQHIKRTHTAVSDEGMGKKKGKGGSSVEKASAKAANKAK